MDLARLAALIAVLATAVAYGTDVFCALVQRPALARVDDQALTAVMGNVHRYGDRRMPVPGASSDFEYARLPRPSGLYRFIGIGVLASSHDHLARDRLVRKLKWALELSTAVPG